MNNRFGFRDFVISALLLAVIVTLLLGMKQYQRQWQVLQQIQATLDDQTRALARLQRTLEQGVAVANTRGGSGGGSSATAAAATQPENDPFHRLRQARDNADFAEGDWLIDSFSSQIASLTPLVSTDIYGEAVQLQVLETLATRDLKTLEYEPMLAKRWEIEDNSEQYQAWRKKKIAELTEQAKADPAVYQAQLQKQLKVAEQSTGRQIQEGSPGYQQIADQAREQWMREQIQQAEDRPTALRITFWLREGLNFSDGEPLTAEDVVFSFDLIMNPDVAAARQRAYFSRTIDDVKAVGPRRVVFEFSRPYFEALGLAGGMFILPEHYYGPIVEKDPERFNQSQSLLMGSGPYKLESVGDRGAGEDIVLTRNVRYWGPAPPLNRLVFKIYTQDVAEMTAFKNRTIDMFGPSSEQFVALLDDESLVERTEHYNYLSPDSGYTFIAWNQRDSEGEPTRFADKRVRQAMTLLTNRPRIVEQIAHGYGQVATGPFHPNGEQPSPQVEPWPYAPQRARDLLKQAGYYDRDGDGVIEGPKGNDFRFELTYSASSNTSERLVRFLKDAYASAGIILDLNPLEWSVMTQRLSNSSFQAITLGWQSSLETDIYQMFHSDQIKPGGDNFMSYESNKLDQLIEEARYTIDDEQRMNLWRRCHEILHEDQPYTFLMWAEKKRFIDNRYKNIHLLQGGLNSRTEWYVPKRLQRWGN